MFAINRVSAFKEITSESSDLVIRFDNPGEKEKNTFTDPFAHFARKDAILRTPPTIVIFKHNFFFNDKLVTDLTSLFATVLHESYHYELSLRKEAYTSLQQHLWMSKYKIDDFVNAMKEFDEMIGAEHSDEWYEAIAWQGLVTQEGDNPYWTNLPEAKRRQIGHIQLMERQLTEVQKLEMILESGFDPGEGYASPKGSRGSITMERREQLREQIDNINSKIDWDLYRKTRTETSNEKSIHKIEVSK